MVYTIRQAPNYYEGDVSVGDKTLGNLQYVDGMTILIKRDIEVAEMLQWITYESHVLQLEINL